MSVGWFDDLANADLYFSAERLETTVWDAASDAVKTKALKHAYNRIYHDPRYAVPTYADATATQLVVLKIVNGEMANYLLIHLASEDQRKGLQAQGVETAGLVKEKYNKDMLENMPIPALVVNLLEEFDEYGVAAKMIPIDRDEDETMATDVVEED